MGILDTLRVSNSIEHVPSPEPTPEPGTSLAQPGTQPGQLGARSSTMTDPANVQAAYYIEQAGKERRYYRDLGGKDLAFRASDKALTTKQEDRATVAHMLDVAQARGWGELHVRGSAAFKQEVWREGQARGLSVKGYEPTADDRRDLDARRKARQEQAQPAAALAQVQPTENTITPPVQPTVQPANQPTPATPMRAKATPVEGAALPIDGAAVALTLPVARPTNEAPSQVQPAADQKNVEPAATKPNSNYKDARLALELRRAAQDVADTSAVAAFVEASRNPNADLGALREKLEALPPASYIAVTERAEKLLWEQAQASGDYEAYERVSASLPNKERLDAAREELAQDPGRLLEMSEGGKRVLEKMTGDAAQPAKAEGAERPARTVEAGQSAATKDGEQQQYPRFAKEPWMQETNGYEALKPDQQESAQRSHERWLGGGTEEKRRTMGLEEYVSHVQGKEAEAREKAAERDPKAQAQKQDKPEPVLAPTAPAVKAATENGTAEAVQLSPDAKKALSFIEQRIEAQMGNFTREVKAELREHAAQALAKREAEGKPVRVPEAKQGQRRAAKQEDEQPAMKVSVG